MENSTGSQAKEVATNKQNASPAVKIEGLSSEPVTMNINTNNQQEIFPKDCIYVESIKGRFNWKIIYGHYIPYIIRVIDGDFLKFISVRMAEKQLFRTFIKYLHEDIYTCTSIKSHFMSDSEATLFNEINLVHADCMYGKEMFVAGKDCIVSLKDVHEFYSFIDVCNKKLLYSIPPGDNEKCGFIRINSESIVPYCTQESQKHLPIFYFEGATDMLIPRSVKFENWNLAYLKFCFKIHGTINELPDSGFCGVVSLDYIKSFFEPDTNFEEYWPATVVNTHFLTNQKSNYVNPPGVWIKAPPDVVPADNTIPRTLIEPVPPIPQSIPVTMNTYLNGCPENQMGSTMSRSSSLINGADNVGRLTPLIRDAVHTITEPVIGNTESHSNVVSSQYNMTSMYNPMIYNYNIMSHQSHTPQSYSQRNNNNQFQQQQLHSSPVRATVQENYLCRSHGYELTRIPDRPFARDGSNYRAYKIQKVVLQGRVLQCINAKAYLYSDLLVTLNSLVQMALLKCTIERCAYILNKYLNVTIYVGNSEQLALLRSNRCHWLMNAEEIPLAMMESITSVLPQLQTLVYMDDEQIQQYQSGLFKRQKPNLKLADHEGSRPVAGSSISDGQTSTHATTTSFYSATEVNRNDKLNAGTPLSQSPYPHHPPHPYRPNTYQSRSNRPLSPPTM